MVEKSDIDQVSFSERHYDDPQFILWERVVAGLGVMGIDVSDDGNSVIDVTVSLDYVTVRRVRERINADRVSYPIIGTVTREILIRKK